MSSDFSGRGVADRSADSYTGLRVLVLGATGFIGRRVAQALKARDADVIVCGRNATAVAALSSQFSSTPAVCDLTRTDDVARMIRETHPAVVFNLAGYGVDPSERDTDAAYAINARLPSQLIDSLAERPPEWRGCVLVHVGSALEYGDAGGDLRESTTENPGTLYGQSKLAGTRLVSDGCRRRSLAGLTARLFTVYGPGEHRSRLLPSLLETARTGQRLELTSGMQKRDFTFVDDVAEGLLRLAQKAPAPGVVVNLATGRLTTVREFAKRAASVLGIDEELLHFGAIPTRPEEMSHEPVAIRRLGEITEWKPRTSIEQGVLRTFHELNETSKNS